MKRWHWLGLAAAIGLIQATQMPAFAKGGHGGHGHGGHSHGHGGHGHHGHGHTAHAHHSGHGGHHGSRRAHHHGIHSGHHAGHHAAWAHHYGHHHHGWAYHHGWHSGWGNHGWGWGGGWNWWGGGVNVDGPTYVDPGYVGPNVVVAPQTLPPAGPQGFFSVVGTIRRINGNAVSVAPVDGDLITIDATPGTTVVLNSQQSTLADLRPSDRVKARYDANNQALTLVAVR
ncbi:MAG TPA: hypothetical protein VEI07_02935 [Planctomycetaceae bacterium]|nr:hypothetical protein [Planctomycetaceae bacterium]